MIRGHFGAPEHLREACSILCPQIHLRTRQHSPLVRHLNPLAPQCRLYNRVTYSQSSRQTAAAQPCRRSSPACSHCGSSSSIAPELDCFPARQRHHAQEPRQHSQWRCRSRHAWQPLDRRKSTVTHCLSEASGPFANSSSQHDDELAPPKASAGVRQVMQHCRVLSSNPGCY
jgi:hypothetical protein